MYKSKLQELCRQKSCNLPEYSTTKEGRDHNPSFHATVTANNQSFSALASAKSSKLVQNTVAKLAFNYFSSLSRSPEEVQRLYKNMLQSYCQKRGLSLHAYCCELKGPPHACSFKSKVMVGDKTYESAEFFPTLSKAEHALQKLH